MEEHKKANLFVVGAMRAGTTSLMSVLEQHPEIYASPIKEPNYFVDRLPKEVYSPDKKFIEASYFKIDFPKKLHIAHIQSKAAYEQLFSFATDQKYRVEASTCYLHAPGTPSKLKQYNPNAKIIVLLRDPVERAYSQYAMNVGLGRENKSFEAVVKKELNELQNGPLPWHSIIHMSCYDTAVEIYSQLFDNVCVLPLTHLLDAPKEAFNTIAEFLQIAPFHSTFLPKTNQAIHFKNKQIVYLLKKVGLKRLVSSGLGSSTKQKILGALSRKNATPLIPEILEKQLREVFAARSLVYFDSIERTT
ncbi:sulfotransferase [Rasiella rasia]|uniref:Sulfotransferase n=1 Tax=Rasiella rasia TaxID=2744027 RepID=A0A6G6GKP1_9FLAO|nr:sulfotransferase [Rasiella rasia]QIE58261.1 sulfotransferase [Rasiella rasia]